MFYAILFVKILYEKLLKKGWALMIKRNLSFYITSSHPDYKTVKQQAAQARRLYNTLNKLKHEKSELYKNTAAQTPVANSLNIDLTKSYSEAWRKPIEQAQSIVLPQKVAQHVGKQCDEAWVSVIKKRAQGLKTGDPKYKHKYAELRFTKQAIAQSKKVHKKNILIPSGWKNGVQLPEEIKLIQVESAVLIPRPDGFELKVLYVKDLVQQPFNKEDDNTVYASGDLGLNKLITIITTEGSRPKTVDGKSLKSINRFFNKKISSLKSLRDKTNDNNEGGEKERLNKTIQRLWFKREKQINHFLNAASNEIVKYLLQKGVQCFVIGWSKGFKNEINLGRKNNQNFASIPHGKFRDLLIRKCAEAGIRTIVQEESYTSKASFIDNDSLPVYSKSNLAKHRFSGHRVKRGEYVSRNGSRIHADVNAAWNILRKCKPSIGWGSSIP